MASNASAALPALAGGYSGDAAVDVPKKLTTFTLWGGGAGLRYADFSTEVDVRSGAQSFEGRRRSAHTRSQRGDPRSPVMGEAPAAVVRRASASRADGRSAALRGVMWASAQAPQPRK